ncbi:pyridoxal phosphate-dependent aminotransferase [Gorillibacterium timonense]|uniref:pyridoxal phosphate-dependent aminotransferase n=1 Tax=Gorillibacterium timonense TaxID=1689269 RepID=UPI00071DBB92|nr:histidinol-phosphate transaminase [Gorillibacterium timonense]
MLETYGHGGDWQTARQLYGRDEFVDFSSNMNPLGPPPAVRDILQGGMDWIVRYPDPAVRELRSKLARLHGIPEESILVGNGAAELIDLAVRLIRPWQAILAKPCFGEYEEAVVKVGGDVHSIPLKEANGFRLEQGQVEEMLTRLNAGSSGGDRPLAGAWREGQRGEKSTRPSDEARGKAPDAIRSEQADGAKDAILAAARNGLADEDPLLYQSDVSHSAAGPDLWILGSPNNPTGQLLDDSVLEAIRESGRILLLDEAFMDFVEREEEGRASKVQAATRDKNLLVLRSMTKFYSIPGIRLGYIVSHPDRIAELRALQIPWSVNALAQAIGSAVVDDRDFVRRTEAWLREEGPWLAQRLRHLGLTVYPSVVNYLLVRLPDSSGWTAALLQEAMGRRGVLIRDASRMGNLSSAYIRLAVKARRDHERLLAALEECLRLGPAALASADDVADDDDARKAGPGQTEKTRGEDRS